MAEEKSPSVKPVVSRKAVMLFAIGWLILWVAGFMVVYQFTKREQTRDTVQWQRQLQLTAESQRRQVEQWLSSQQAVVSGLAENTSLQLYLTELNGSNVSDEDVVQHEGEPATPQNADQAFKSFLTSLLISEASQHGFYEPKASDEIPANVPSAMGSGLAILGKDGKPIVSTLGMPGLNDLPELVQVAFQAGKPLPLGPFLLSNEKPYLIFSAPVSGVQSDAPEGVMLGVKLIHDEFAQLLALPPQAEPTSESVLVRRDSENLQYLTALQDGTKPMALSLNFATPSLAEAYVVENPGVFVEKRDYRGHRVLAVGQNIQGTDWVLVHKIDADVAFADTKKRQEAMLIGYILLVAFISVTIVAVWRNLSARRAKQAANHYQQLAQSAEKQKSLLSHLIETLIMLVDSRDPHAQRHSNGVALISAAIAKHMELSEAMQETTALAASLMNVGKIRAPENLLKQKELSPEDKNQIRQSMLASADILKDVAFDGPVVETLKQSLEHVDGSGPLGLKEDEILISAKIIAVANAFIAMISERAYRGAMSMEAALDAIRGAVDKIYSRPVVAALEHYLENAGGREAVEMLMQQPQKKAV